MVFMAARAIGTVTISFGLVSVPVKLYSATQAQGAVSFNLLHKGCGSRLKQQYICQNEGTVVERDDMVKGYEFAKDQYVMFTPEELKALEERATQTVDITEFVPVAQVDPVFYDKPYYLAPEKGGEKAYRLLTDAMQETGRCALARYAARGKQYLVMLRPVSFEGAGGIVMQQLLYADEVRSFKEVPLNQGAEPKEAELNLAKQLIGQISNETFNPTAYEDDVKKRILGEIDKKVAGQEISTAAPEETGQAQVIDIMEALKASLAKPKSIPIAPVAPKLVQADDEHRATKAAAAPKKAESKKASKK
jgi:DNA end-binding protein Ku